MKVLLINTLYTPYRVGGAELFVESLATGLSGAGSIRDSAEGGAKSKVEVVVASTAPRSETRSDEVSNVGVRYVGLENLYWPYVDGDVNPVLKPFSHALDSYNPLMARKLNAVIEEESPDIVNTHNLNGFSVSAWDAVKRHGLPLVHTLHDHYLLCPKSTMFRQGVNCQRRCADCLLYSLTRQRGSGLVDAVVGVSRFILDRHLEFGYFKESSKKAVIPNSCEPADGPTETTPARRPTRFGYIGQLAAPKGIEVFLRAAGRIPEGARNFTVAGKGKREYEAHLKRDFSGPNVSFVGYTDPSRFFSGIDVLVVPSLLKESFGRVVIEAYSHGVPVIGTSRGGVEELVREGETGLLFDPDDPGSLDSAISAFLEDPGLAQSMSVACRKESRRFSPDGVTGDYLALYEKLLEAG